MSDPRPCTCANRSLKLSEAVIYERVGKQPVIFARDCPAHGVFPIAPEAPVNQNDMQASEKARPDAQ